MLNPPNVTIKRTSAHSMAPLPNASRSLRESEISVRFENNYLKHFVMCNDYFD